MYFGEQEQSYYKLLAPLSVALLLGRKQASKSNPCCRINKRLCIVSKRIPEQIPGRLVEGRNFSKAVCSVRRATWFGRSTRIQRGTKRVRTVRLLYCSEQPVDANKNKRGQKPS